MTNPFDSLKLALTCFSPYTTYEKKIKETLKYEIENLNLLVFHKLNMKAIVENSHSENELLTNLGIYISSNNLF